MKIRVRHCSKSWIWDQYLSKHMNWILVVFYQQTWGGFLIIWVDRSSSGAIITGKGSFENRASSGAISIGKSMRNKFGFFLHLLGHLYGTSIKIIGLEAPGNYSASIWINEISILSLEKNQQTIISMIWGFLDVSRPFKTNNVYFWRHKIFLNISETHGNIFKASYFYQSQSFGNPPNANFRKDGHRQIMKIR